MGDSDEDAGEGDGWDVGDDDLELPADLVRQAVAFHLFTVIPSFAVVHVCAVLVGLVSTHILVLDYFVEIYFGVEYI